MALCSFSRIPACSQESCARLVWLTLVLIPPCLITQRECVLNVGTPCRSILGCTPASFSSCRPCGHGLVASALRCFGHNATAP